MQTRLNDLIHALRDGPGVPVLWRGYGARASMLLLCCALCACPKIPEPYNGNGEELYARDVSGGIHEITSARGPLKPLTITRNGTKFKCSNCHGNRYIERRSQKALETEHKNIVFRHGRNVLCLNCHNARAPDIFVNHGGEPIAADQPTELCSKCHGPHYREWNHGIHGRANGHWSDEYGERKRLHCIECHDPHWPKFKKMKPEPPPVLTRFSSGSDEELHHAE